MRKKCRSRAPGLGFASWDLAKSSTDKINSIVVLPSIHIPTRPNLGSVLLNMAYRDPKCGAGSCICPHSRNDRCKLPEPPYAMGDWTSSLVYVYHRRLVLYTRGSCSYLPPRLVLGWHCVQLWRLELQAHDGFISTCFRTNNNGKTPCLPSQVCNHRLSPESK